MLSGDARNVLAAVLLSLAVSAGHSAAHAEVGTGETVDQAVCRFIEAAAQDHAIPRGFLTRLIWRESSFRAHVVSHAGAQGIAQFMPGTAIERGLADPFDPEQAIPSAASFLADLNARFGNLGLAAAAYNAGATRVANWLDKRSGLPLETRDFVFNVTSHSAEDWAASAAGEMGAIEAADKDRPCIELAAFLRGPGAPPGFEAEPFAPWGVQLAGNFSRDRALASFRREVTRYEDILGDIQPMIIGTRLPGRGSAPFFRVRVPAQTRDEAQTLCTKIRAAGGSCIVLRS
ncbi:MAG: lytic transglycosylase domain-containing protein [Salinarimonas sp.]|nr:lytic transglycosylase domain-containing protein [Salinarimonas sp.]